MATGKLNKENRPRLYPQSPRHKPKGTHFLDLPPFERRIESKRLGLSLKIKLCQPINLFKK